MHAESAIDQGDLKAAQADYAKASALSSDAKVAERAFGLALAVHDKTAARNAIARMQALDADPLSLMRAQAQLALDEGRTDDARRLLMQMTASGKKSAWQTFGKVLLDARDVAQAGRLLEQVATPERLPADVKAWLAMSEMGQKMMRYAYAQRIADLAAKRFDSAEAYAWSANLHAQRGETRAALALYDKAVTKSPDDIDLRLAYAGLLAKQGDPAAAEKVLAKGRQDARSFAARVAFAARAKDIPNLHRIYGELVKAPDAIRKQSYFLLGQLASALGKNEEAVAWLAKVPADGDHGMDAGIRRAVLLQELGHPAKAHALVDSLRQGAGKQKKVLRRLDQVDAELYMNQGKYDQAAKAYTRALAFDSDATELLYGRGLAYAEAGRTDAAINDLREVLRQTPDDINAINALGYTLADAGRNLGEATRLLKRARDAQPDDPAIIDSWGWLQYRLGHLEAAEKALRRSWDKRQDPDVGGHLAQVLLARGKKAEAGRIFRQALKLDPGNPHLLALREKMKP